VDDQWCAVIFAAKPLQLKGMSRVDSGRTPHARTRREYLEGIRANLVSPLRSSEDAARRGKVNPDAGSVHLDSV